MKENYQYIIMIRYNKKKAVLTDFLEITRHASQ